MAPVWPLPPHPPFDKAFEPYALEIGFLLREWNDLQEQFLELFVTLLSVKDVDAGISIWHVVPNDRQQRRMLRALAEVRFGAAGPRRQTAELDEATLAELDWLVRSADDLGSMRDDAAHAPVAMLLQEPFEFVAHHLTGNPRAKTLKGKRLLDEFRLYRARASVLGKHAHALNAYLRDGRRSTRPQRPTWPTLRKASDDKSRPVPVRSQRRKRSLPSSGE